MPATETMLPIPYLQLCCTVRKLTLPRSVAPGDMSRPAAAAPPWKPRRLQCIVTALMRFLFQILPAVVLAVGCGSGNANLQSQPAPVAPKHASAPSQPAPLADAGG